MKFVTRRCMEVTERENEALFFGSQLLAERQQAGSSSDRPSEAIRPEPP